MVKPWGSFLFAGGAWFLLIMGKGIASLMAGIQADDAKILHSPGALHDTVLPTR